MAQLKKIHPTEQEIITAFKKASIYINKITQKCSDKGMISVVHPDYGIKMFPTYYAAFCFYEERNMIQ